MSPLNDDTLTAASLDVPGGSLPWSHRAGQEEEFSSWKECLEALLKRGGPRVWYRGQGQFEWPLVCTFDRALRDNARSGGEHSVDLLESMVNDPAVKSWALRKESELLQWFSDLARQFGVPGLPPANDRLGWWELMQHHGTPTRLIDWTRSPFIALWFAFEHEGDSDAAMWVLDARNCVINLHEMMGEVLNNSAFDTDGRLRANRLTDLAIERGTPIPLPLSPRYTLGRAVAQQSVLTLVANVPYPTVAGHTVRSYLATKVRLRKEWRDEAMGACSSLGIDRLSLFRDLDTLGSALRASLTLNLPLPRPA
jgi:hypothetical protein